MATKNIPTTTIPYHISPIASLDIYHQVFNGKIIKKYKSNADLHFSGDISKSAGKKKTRWYLDNIGAGATFEKNIRLVELENGKRVWWVDIVDNEFEEKVADWIFDEYGNTLLCYPDPKEFDKILLEIDKKHGWNEWHEPPPKTQVILNEKGEFLLKIPKEIAQKMPLNPKDKVHIWIYENQIRIEKEKKI